MNTLSVFLFDSKEIRVTDQNGDPWFVLRDLLDAMESSTTTNNAISSIEQGLGKGYSKDIPLQTAGGVQNVIVVHESAATFLVARSNTEKGRALNRFIHVEVLPQIRKTGSYTVQAQPRDELDVLSGIVDALKAQRDELKQIRENQNILTKASQGMWTKLKNVDESVDQRILEKLDRFWDNTKNMSATDVGRQLRCSAQEVNRCAAFLGWIEPIFKNPSNMRKGIDGWELQEEGRLYASQRFDNNGHPVSPVFYGKEAVEQIRALRNSRPNSAWSLTQIISLVERRQQDNAA
jgi:prophage antirepressor-like protein